MLKKTLTFCVGMYLYFVLVLVKLGGLSRGLSSSVYMDHMTDARGVQHRKLKEVGYFTKLQDVSNNIEKKLYNECVTDSSFEMQCQNSCFERNSSNIIKVPLPSSACALEILVGQCDVLKTLNGYNSIPVTNEEKNFPLAFAMKLHDSPEQAEQIFRTIYRPHNIYCLHVDKKADISTFQIIQNMSKCFDNVILIEDREKMVSSSFTHVTSELKCMNALTNSPVNWKYYINLSGKDFPLRTNLEMVRILKLFKGLNDIETYDHPVFHSWRHANKFHIFGNSLAQVEPKPALKYTMKVGMGNAFGLFSKEFVRFILTDDVANEILVWFNDTFAPHESVWATLVTLPWAPGGYPVTVRHMINSFVSRAFVIAGDSAKCHGQYVRGQCIFSCGDLLWITSRPQFMASKFDYDRDRQTLNCLEMWYRQKAYQTENVKVDWNYYNKLPHLKYYRTVKHFQKSTQKMAEIKKDWIKQHMKFK